MEKSKIIKRISNKTLALSAVTILFMIWSGVFILRSSFIAIDGLRHFSLFDDAMISMRYAWNLSHGLGLVWNEGVRIEGFTNTLMTLYMALVTAFMDKSASVLFIQFSGIGFMLAIAYFSMKIAQETLTNITPDNRHFLEVFSFTIALCYYPMAYWSLMGMETGLLAVLVLAATWIAMRSKDRLEVTPILPILMGLAFWTRPDALIQVSLIMVYRAFGIMKLKGDRNIILKEAAILSLFIISLTAFRYFYYHDIVPNTYTLKMTGMPLMSRLNNGLKFIQPFLLSVGGLFFIALLGVGLNFSMGKLLLIFLFLSPLAHQIWVGGDAWPYWRMMSFAMPLLALLSVDGILSAVQILSKLRAGNNYIRNKILSHSHAEKIIMACILFVLMAKANYKFIPEMFLHKPPYQVLFNKWNVNTAIALKDVCGPNASISIFWAGAIPYYTGFKAIDMLGKSDKYIASLPVQHQYHRPGHNKSDLSYSIINQRPTYVQKFQWGYDEIWDFANKHYKLYRYKKYVYLWLLNDSKDVDWKNDRLSISQKNIPEK